jgi:hypothetical protein
VKETCPICGDYLPSQTKTITEELSDHFVLDTGSVVCKECFDMEAPPEQEMGCTTCDGRGGMEWEDHDVDCPKVR